MYLKSGLLVAALILLTGCRPSPDTIYINGVIWTGSATNDTVEALAISGDVITHVGGSADISRLASSRTDVVDLEGAFVVPGLIDNHVHFLDGGFGLQSVDLRSAQTPGEFTERLRSFAATRQEGRWITGGDWDHETWGGALPRREWIDAVTTDNPVFVYRLDGHMALANTIALDVAGITRETPDPPGGTIVRDPKTGEPTGVLKDEAMGLVWPHIPDPSEQELDGALQIASEHALAHGVTQVHDMATWASLETYRRARARGELALRIYSFVPLGTWERLRDFVTENGRGDALLRWGGLKGFVDGSLGSTTAWFYEPYVDEPETSGLITTDTTSLREWIIGADRAGLQIGVHAIGDRANDWLLDVYEQAAELNGARDRRFRIEHAQHLSRAAVARFAGLGVIASMQPYHAIDDGRWAEKRIGPERIQQTYPFRSLLDAGARLTFGSDWTVAPMNPLLGVYAAVTRRTLDDANPDGWVPEQKISVEEALGAYTAANAYAGFQESVLGTLETGKLADFVVLCQNLFDVEPAAIGDVCVRRTVVGGKVRFAAETER